MNLMMIAMKMRYFCILWLLLGVTACQEDEIDLYSGDPAISMAVILENGRTDTTRSINFGFMTEKEITVDFLAKLEGLPVGYERNIKFVLGGDAIRGTDYEFPDKVILPDGAHEVRIPCRIKCDGSLMDQNRTIVLAVIPDETFVKGFQSSARVVIGDGMPGEWVGGDYWYILGHCSRLKYRFLYDMLGYYDLGAFSYSELMVMATYLQQKVTEYNMNPEQFGNKYGPVPMTDELGWTVFYGYEDPNTPPVNPDDPFDPIDPMDPINPIDPIGPIDPVSPAEPGSGEISE